MNSNHPTISLRSKIPLPVSEDYTTAGAMPDPLPLALAASA